MKQSIILFFLILLIFISNNIKASILKISPSDIIQQDLILPITSFSTFDNQKIKMKDLIKKQKDMNISTLLQQSQLETKDMHIIYLEEIQTINISVFSKDKKIVSRSPFGER